MRKSYLLLCGVIVAVCLWLVLHRLSGEHAVVDVPDAAPVAASPVARPVQAHPAQKLPAPVQASSPAIADRSQPGTDPARMARLVQVENQWRAPITFYGKVIDENSNIIAGADVNFGWTDLSADGHSSASTRSDANGLFSLTGKNGKCLSVQVSKMGFYASKRDEANFFYAGANENFVADSRNPVVFHLRKKEKGMPLIHVGGTGLHVMRDYLLSANGTPTDVSLLTGQQMPPGQGDLELTFQAGQPLANFPSRITWQCQVSVPGGGLVPTGEEFPFLAPQSGYQPSDFWSITATNWTEQVNQQYYVQLKSANFGRVNLQVIGASRPYFRLDSFVDPSGSTDLEPAQQ